MWSETNTVVLLWTSCVKGQVEGLSVFKVSSLYTTCYLFNGGTLSLLLV